MKVPSGGKQDRRLAPAKGLEGVCDRTDRAGPTVHRRSRHGTFRVSSKLSWFGVQDSSVWSLGLRVLECGFWVGLGWMVSERARKRCA